AVWRIVLEPTIIRRIVRRRDYDAVGESSLPSVVITEDGVGDGGSGCVGRPFREHHHDAIRRKHLQGAGERRLRQRMSVHSKKQRPLDLLQFAVIADRLGDGENMPLIECAVESRPAVSRRTKDDPLLWVVWVGLPGVVSRHQFWDVDQDRGIRWLSGGCTHFHLSPQPKKGLKGRRLKPGAHLNCPKISCSHEPRPYPYPDPNSRSPPGKRLRMVVSLCPEIPGSVPPAA